MPPHVNLERLIGTALVDRGLREVLLASPATAAATFGLSPEELDVLEAANACSLEEMAGHVYAWISRMPHPRRSTRRQVADGYQLARAAV